MKHTFKKLPHSVYEIEVELNHQEFLNFWQPIYDGAISSVHLKGFRPGTAPKELVDKSIDKEKVFEEAVKDAVKENLKKITEEKNWKLVDQPKIEVSESQPSANLGLKYKATIAVFPEIKISDYKKISKKVFADKKEVKVDEKEIKKSIDFVVNSRAKLIRVSREAEKGDVVDLDFEGFLDGKSLDDTKSKGDRFVLGEGKFIPGFEENILNHKEGDSFEFSIKFPSDYWKDTLREKDVLFKVKLLGILKRELPELNDEFVKSLGNFSGVDDFKKNIAEGLKKEEKEKLRLKALDEIIKKSEIDIPKVMIERTLENMVAEFQAYSGAGKSKEELKEKLKESARNNVLNNLIIYQIAKLEGLEPAEKEVEEEVNHYLAHNQFTKKPKIDPRQLYDYIYGVVRNKKVFEFLENLK